jgi:hypothetical protein
MSESKRGGGDSLKDGMLFENTELREMRDVKVSFFGVVKSFEVRKEKEKRFCR